MGLPTQIPGGPHPGSLSGMYCHFPGSLILTSHEPSHSLLQHLLGVTGTGLPRARAVRGTWPRARGVRGTVHGARGVRGTWRGAKGVGGTVLGVRVSIEEIAPIYMILHAKAFQMQSAPIHLSFHACLL